jgi:hypothetical protein
MAQDERALGASSVGDQTDASGKKAGEGLSRLGELAWQALPAIGSAVGFAGFVAVIGAAIEWIRFDAAGLPATQAVLAVPKQELVIIGALALVVSLVGAMLAVLLVYLIDENGDATPSTARGLVAVGVVEMLATMRFIGERHVIVYVLLVFWLAVIYVAAAYVVAAAMGSFTRRSKLKRARTKLIEARDKWEAAGLGKASAEQLVRQSDTDVTKLALTQTLAVWSEAQGELERAIREWATTVDDVMEKELDENARAVVRTARDEVSNYLTPPVNNAALEQNLEMVEQAMRHALRAIRIHLLVQVSPIAKKLEDGGRRARRKFAIIAPKILKDRFSLRPEGKPTRGSLKYVVAGIVVVLALGLIVYGILRVVTEGSFSWIAILLLVAAVLAMTNLSVARATEKFAWYGVSVFFSVLLFGTALTIARTLDKPTVQPITLVRKGTETGICGVFITQTNERVYIGRLAPPGRSGAPSGRPGLIFWVPTNDVDLVSVGRAQHINSDLPRLTRAMLGQLYKDRAEEAAQTLKNTTVMQVTKRGNSNDTTTKTSEVQPSEKVRPMPHPHRNVGEDCTVY